MVLLISPISKFDERGSHLTHAQKALARFQEAGVGLKNSTVILHYDGFTRLIKAHGVSFDFIQPDQAVVLAQLSKSQLPVLGYREFQSKASVFMGLSPVLALPYQHCNAQSFCFFDPAQFRHATCNSSIGKSLRTCRSKKSPSWQCYVARLGVALGLGGPGSDPGDAEDEQPHDEPSGVTAAAAKADNAADENGGVNEGGDEQKDVEVPATLGKTKSSLAVVLSSHQTPPHLRRVLTTMTPRTLRRPSA